MLLISKSSERDIKNTSFNMYPARFITGMVQFLYYFVLVTVDEFIKLYRLTGLILHTF